MKSEKENWTKLKCYSVIVIVHMGTGTGDILILSSVSATHLFHLLVIEVSD